MTGTVAGTRAPAGVARLLAGLRDDGGRTGIDRHLATYGPLPAAPGRLVETLDAAGLRGRGGAAFPTAAKLRGVLASGRRPVVVVNAAEGEPASGKDAALLRSLPHLVLDGAAACAAAIGAREAVIAVGSARRDALAGVAAALGERRDDVRWRVVPVPSRFVAGEETALLRAVAGRPATPTLKPPFPFERGLGGRPTLVQNAETLAHAALIARFGPRWFRALGTADEPGTALLSVSGAVRRPGIHEVELGTTVADAIATAGGASEPAGAVLVGGYFGTWTRDPAHALLAAQGLGAGVLVVLPARACGLRESARVVRFLARESAGQCGPCVHGLAAIADAFERLAAGAGRADDLERLSRWGRDVTGRGACRHPDGAAGFVGAAIETFADEVEAHLRGRCRGADLGVLPVSQPR